MGHPDENNDSRDTDAPDSAEASSAPRDGDGEDRPVGGPGALDLSRTLPTGAAFQATWKMPAFRLSQSQALAQPNESGVHELSVPDQAAVHPAGHKVTLTSLVPPAAELLVSAAERASETSPSAAPGGRTLSSFPARTPVPAAAPHAEHGEHREQQPDTLDLTKTLRMDFSVHAPLPGAKPAASTVEPVTGAPESAPPASDAPRRPATIAISDNVFAATVQRVGVQLDEPSDSTRPARLRTTDPLGLPSTRSVASTPAEPKPAPGASSAAASDAAIGRGRGARARRNPFVFDRDAASAFERNAAPDQPPAPAQRRGPKDKLMWGLLAAAAVSTALLFLMEPSSSDDEEPKEAEKHQPHADVTAPAQAPKKAGPHVVLPAGATPASSGAAKGPEAATSAPAVAASSLTEIVSTPAAAEIVFGGAVIANTPARLSRTDYETDYLVRLPGYESQLVRLSASSPATIRVVLVRDGREQPLAPPAAQGTAAKAAQATAAAPPQPTSAVPAPAQANAP